MANTGVRSWSGTGGHITIIEVVHEPYRQYAVHGDAYDRLRARASMTRDEVEGGATGIKEVRLPMWIIAA